MSKTNNIPATVLEQIEEKWPIEHKVLPNGDTEFINSRTKLTNTNCREAALRGAEIALQSQWVKCSDRMPDKGERVIVFGENLSVCSHSVYLNVKGKWTCPDMKSLAYSKNVTHWQSLPEPPKE